MGQCRENIFHEEREVYAVEKNVVAMLLRPGKEAMLINIEPSFRQIEELVGGLADLTWPINERFCIAVNDTGKLDGLPLNRALRNAEGKIVDIYAGNVVILGSHGGEGFDDLMPDEVEELMERFGKQEYGWEVEGLPGGGDGLGKQEDGCAQAATGRAESFGGFIGFMKKVFGGRKE